MDGAAARCAGNPSSRTLQSVGRCSLSCQFKFGGYDPSEPTIVSNTLMVGRCLQICAYHRAFIPPLQEAVGSAPFLSSKSHICAWPTDAASISAVCPAAFGSFTFAPAASSVSTVLNCPQKAATITGYHPRTSTHDESVFPGLLPGKRTAYRHRRFVCLSAQRCNGRVHLEGAVQTMCLQQTRVRSGVLLTLLIFGPYQKCCCQRPSCPRILS